MTKEERLYETIQKGVNILREDYKQITIVRKANVLGGDFNPSTLANILARRNTNVLLLMRVAKFIEEIVWREKGLRYNTDTRQFQWTEGSQWIAEIVPEQQEIKQTDHLESPLVLHADGRPTILQKAAFIRDAQKHIIEFGIRLRTFSEYFISSNEAVYKARLAELLKNGVNMDCYVLRADSHEARVYFEDRAKVMASEKKALEGAIEALENMKALEREFAACGYRGQFRLWQYRHIPYNHFLAVDPEEPHGKIQFSHYLYGIRRSECLVWEIYKAQQPILYEKYWTSLRLSMEGARREPAASIASL
jgi:hypothetical protein